MRTAQPQRASSTNPPPGEPNTPPATNCYLVSWDAVPDPQVTAYKLYYSTSPLNSGATAQTITLGTLTSYSFSPGSTGISSGTTVYVAVATTGNGMESPLSDPISVVVQ